MPVLSAPLRKITKWIGPSSALVQLECGHRANTQAAHATRCQECGKLIRTGKPLPLA